MMFQQNSLHAGRFSEYAAIWNFNEDDVKQCDNLVSKKDICRPRSTLLDELHWNDGN